MGLNKEQQQAAEMLNNPLMILASAGAGKTTTMVHRICNLIDSGVQPHNILAVSFTRKAANEIKERVDKLLGNRSATMTISTFHSLASRIMRKDAETIGLKTNFDIVDEKGLNVYYLETLKSLNVEELYKGEKLDSVFNPIQLAKCNLVYPNDFKTSPLVQAPNRDALSKIYIRYQEHMKSKNKVDFGDLLLYANRILDNSEVKKYYQNLYTHIIVDEYQDSNRAQYALVYKIAKNHRNICVIGDPEQRIFSFQGANPEGESQFISDFPEYTLIKLEQNYRSTTIIVDASNELIKHNKKRMDKTVWTDNKKQTKIGILNNYDNNEETRNILQDITKKMTINPNLQYKDFAILYRNHFLAFKLEKYFKGQKIPYVVRGNLQYFCDLPEIKDILSYFKIVDNPYDDANLIYSLQMFPGIGGTTTGKLKSCAETHKISMYEALQHNANNNPIYLCGIRTQEFKLLPNALNGINFLIDMYATEGLNNFTDFIIEEMPCVQKIKNSTTITSKEKYLNIVEFQRMVKNYIFSQEQQNLTPVIKECLDIIMLDSPVVVEDEDGINMSTIHSAKGLEFEYVYLIGCENRVMPSVYSRSTEDLEEERRLMYVAMTRAKEQLIISQNEYREDEKHVGKLIPVSSSPYLKEFSNSYTQLI